MTSHDIFDASHDISPTRPPRPPCALSQPLQQRGPHPQPAGPPAPPGAAARASRRPGPAPRPAGSQHGSHVADQSTQPSSLPLELGAGTQTEQAPPRHRLLPAPLRSSPPLPATGSSPPLLAPALPPARPLAFLKKVGWLRCTSSRMASLCRRPRTQVRRRPTTPPFINVLKGDIGSGAQRTSETAADTLVLAAAAACSLGGEPQRAQTTFRQRAARGAAHRLSWRTAAARPACAPGACALGWRTRRRRPRAQRTPGARGGLRTRGRGKAAHA
jgi:hypothetical protein